MLHNNREDFCGQQTRQLNCSIFCHVQRTRKIVTIAQELGYFATLCRSTKTQHPRKPIRDLQYEEKQFDTPPVFAEIEIRHPRR